MKKADQSYVISIMSRDRVGIVHEVSQAISELEGNIADIRQSVMCGYFTMILLASFPGQVNQRTIEQKFAEVDAHSDTAIAFSIKQVENGTPISPDRELSNAYVLTASGSDRIGFVASVTSFCVRHCLNILDLSTTTAHGDYLMVLIVDISGCSSLASVREDLGVFCKETGLRMVLQHYDIFKAVNEINLPIR
jgi:glycine cleavage system transcriptional repressor